ncbi:23S rRNA (uracil(1939)-C(5))-methyltransferase RlmD [Paenibacillus thermotolerans]|uniref:23S rRNA (uracil(1939)-C(5))-methyltransferase RlmD n=1 Tax=Paenibacillus thermotolerans TaxID=3027807 RepID=UPI002367EF94|nr:MULTISPECIES: 23S rRNA (uracil(1939)-C(5))-methyltransferase RlmD [unclassified Paenibacillus]
MDKRGKREEYGNKGKPKQKAGPASAKITAAEADRLQPGDTVAVTIKRLGINGEGVGYYKRKTIFVEGALPGEVVKAKITRAEPKLLYATTLQIERPSEHRTTPFCPMYEQCGGCQLQHMAYQGQLKEKEEIVREAFYRYAGIAGETLPLLPIIGMEEPSGYRNKAQLQIGMSGGDVLAGLYSPGSRRLIDITGCPVQHGKVNDTLRTVKTIVAALKLPVADPARYRGASAAEPEDGEYAVRASAARTAAAGGKPAARHAAAPKTAASALRTIVARASFATGAMQLTFVTTGSELPSERALVREVRTRLPDVVSIAHNVNPADTPLVFGDHTRVVWGDERMEERLGRLTFELSPRAFFQLNPSQTVRLYDAAKKAAALTGAESVVDAYCGVGTISLWLADAAKEVRGIEAVADAVTDARRNAQRNNVANAAFYAGLAEELLPQWAQAGYKPDVAVVDPPRSGCDRRLLDALTRTKPKRIVYVSCNPATLAKDAKVLLDGGYTIASIQPVDMFPHTSHVEVVCELVGK